MDRGILEINLNGTPKFKKTIYLLYGICIQEIRETVAELHNE
jgi:hypothetical protein